MSEALHGGHDSRPGENPQASAGRSGPDQRAAAGRSGPNPHTSAGESGPGPYASARGSGADPYASAGQSGPPPGTRPDPGEDAQAVAHERDNEAPLGAPNSHSQSRADGGQQGPGGDSYAWYRRGLDLLSRGSPAAAAELLERAAEAEPGARSIREALARAQFDAGRYAQAADNFRQNVEAIPSDDYAHFGLGLALARGGDPAAAAEHLALAAAMRPELAHYTDALRGVRATLAARTQAGAGAPSTAAPDGDEPR